MTARAMAAASLITIYHRRGRKSIEETKSKKKTRTSSAVKNRYNAKTYKKFQANVKPDIAERIEAYLRKEKINKVQFLSRAINMLDKE